jgi:hypothetical protein
MVLHIFKVECGRHNVFYRTVDGHIDAPYLLERVGIHIPDNTGNKYFFTHHSIKNSPLAGVKLKANNR